MIRQILFPPKSEWNLIAERPVQKQQQLSDLVHEIFERIQTEGDRAVTAYTEQFDGVSLTSLQVESEVVKQASSVVSEELKNAIRTAKQNIERFHASQFDKNERVETMPGVFCWRESRAIDRIGIYVPGGTAPLFSTVLMLAVPAVLAGCKEIVLCTPADKKGQISPAILYAADLVGVTSVFAIGGIQAIGALAFGTESVPKVDKIFGPGNQYVTAAKQAVQQFGVAIDLPAGPSEVLVIADNSSNASFVAADLLSQAEHGADSQVILLATDEKVARNVEHELCCQLAELPRKELAEKSLLNSKIIVMETMDDCIAFSNLYAPEHLILAVDAAEAVATKVVNAGSVFIGNYSCESAGDYASGTNHTLPTNGNARAYSGVSLDSFVKKITFQKITPQGLMNIGPIIETMAEAEQLFAHKNAVTLRLKNLKND